MCIRAGTSNLYAIFLFSFTVFYWICFFLRIQLWSIQGCWSPSHLCLSAILKRFAPDRLWISSLQLYHPVCWNAWYSLLFEILLCNHLMYRIPVLLGCLEHPTMSLVLHYTASVVRKKYFNLWNVNIQVVPALFIKFMPVKFKSVFDCWYPCFRSPKKSLPLSYPISLNTNI